MRYTEICDILKSEEEIPPKNEKEKNNVKKNQDDVIITESTDGDGTVLMNSLTVFKSFTSERVYIKGNSGSFISNHTNMVTGYAGALDKILGKAPEDLSTIYFIVKLIDNSYLNINFEALRDDYCLTKGYISN